MTMPRFLKSAEGAAAAEMALVLPFLIVLLFGGMELGYYFYSEHQVVKGVRDGARFASRQAFSSINCGSPIPLDVRTAIQEITRTGQISGGTSRIPGWTNDDIDVSVTCPSTAIATGIYKNEGNAPQINIATSVIYPSLFDGVGIIDSTYTLNAEQQAAVTGL